MSVPLYNSATFFPPGASRYRVIKELGTGAYGAVAQCLDTTLGIKVAVKKVPNFLSDLVDAKRVLREAKLLRRLAQFGHENVVELLALEGSGPDFVSSGLVAQPVDVPFTQHPWKRLEDVYMIMSCSETDLHKVLYGTKNVLSLAHISYFIYQLLRSLQFIHSAGILHRDIKPANCLLSVNCDLRVCDFGLARGASGGNLDGSGGTQPPLTEYVVTRWYRAPEIMLGSVEYTYAVDVWSVGCILGELLRKSPIFPGKDYCDQLKCICKVCGSPTEEELAECGAKERALVFMRSKLMGRPRVPWVQFLPCTSPLSTRGLPNSSSVPKNTTTRSANPPTSTTTGRPTSQKGNSTHGIPRASPRGAGAEPPPQSTFILSDSHVDTYLQALDLLNSLLAFSPKRRITVQRALCHPFLKDYHDVSSEPLAPARVKLDWEDFPVEEGRGGGGSSVPPKQRLLAQDIQRLMWEEIVSGSLPAASSREEGGGGVEKPLSSQSTSFPSYIKQLSSTGIAASYKARPRGDVSTQKSALQMPASHHGVPLSDSSSANRPPSSLYYATSIGTAMGTPFTQRTTVEGGEQSEGRGATTRSHAGLHLNVYQDPAQSEKRPHGGEISKQHSSLADKSSILWNYLWKK